MPFFLAGLALLLLLIFGARLLAAANPRIVAWMLRKLGGVMALALAALLALRGAIPLAIPLAIFGFSLVKPRGFSFGGGFGSARKSAGQKSHVSTDALEMELDHDSGEMEGTCLKGRFAGRSLASLSDAELLELLQELRGGDPQEAALLEAYLDWRVRGWREERNGEERAEPNERRGRARSSPGRMSVEEAYAVLGLRAGAGKDEIRRAHRQLMKKMHPDQGGSTYLATRINEAKDVLLGRR